MLKFIVAVITILIAINTASYGLWAWYNGNKMGAVGTWVWAWIALIAPWAVWLTQSLRMD